MCKKFTSFVTLGNAISVGIMVAILNSLRVNGVYDLSWRIITLPVWVTVIVQLGLALIVLMQEIVSEFIRNKNSNN